jgi:hypothetical protein
MGPAKKPGGSEVGVVRRFRWLARVGWDPNPQARRLSGHPESPVTLLPQSLGAGPSEPD